MVVVGVAAGVMVAVAGWVLLESNDADRDRGRLNVLLLTLDTLRADHLGCYGYGGVATPAIDRLAAGGTRFAQASTAVPMTLPSHATIMTGVYPPRHGVRDNGTFQLPLEVDTLAEILQRDGYATAAFIGSFVLDERYGLSQGFDEYDDDLTLEYRLPTPQAPNNPDRPANVVVDSALGWLEQWAQSDSTEPFFVWVHLFDPHQPYHPPEPFRSRYADRPYDGEIAFMDSQIARLLDGVAGLGRTGRTAVIVVGDHGEGLGDHGEDTHRQLIYESTMGVPLILSCPGVIEAGRVVDSFVAATVDVLPTVLGLVGVPIPAGVDGVSLIGAELGPGRAVYLETLSTQLNDGWAPLFGVRDLSGKYIDAPAPEYFDLIDDPGETVNILERRPEAAERLADALAGIVETFGEASSSAAVTPTQEEIERLAALGYVVGSGNRTGPSNLDPKVMIASYNERLRGIHLLQQGRPHEAITVFESLLRQSGGMGSEIWSALASAQMTIGQSEEAIRSGRRSVEQAPHKPDRWCALAELYLRTGNEGEAEICLSQAERQDPKHGEVFLIRARRALDKGRLDEAETQCRRAIEHDTVRAAAEGYALIGQIRRRSGDEALARDAFTSALAHDPRNGTALLGLAEIFADRGQTENAIELCQLLIEGQPEFLAGGRLMARLYFESGQSDVAIAILQTVLQKNPSDQAAHLALSRVLASRGMTDAAFTHLEHASSLGRVDFAGLRAEAAFAPLANDPRWEALEQSRRGD